jgi:hypothetical protein
MAPHAILETARFETPLATKPAVIFGTFSLAGLGDTNRAKSYYRRQDNGRALNFHE